MLAVRASPAGSDAGSRQSARPRFTHNLSLSPRVTFPAVEHRRLLGQYTKLYMVGDGDTWV